MPSEDLTNDLIEEDSQGFRETADRATDALNAQIRQRIRRDLGLDTSPFAGYEGTVLTAADPSPTAVASPTTAVDAPPDYTNPTGRSWDPRGAVPSFAETIPSRRGTTDPVDLGAPPRFGGVPRRNTAHATTHRLDGIDTRVATDPRFVAGLTEEATRAFGNPNRGMARFLSDNTPARPAGDSAGRGTEPREWSNSYEPQRTARHGSGTGTKRRRSK
ncbi:hypothetical protein ABZ896_37765 [Streptomyces sp. NPDC047072]|uniref:hypothetical protein n=1 Tax=Streptomyces sp. NPDC047072 TaxID=3154809 RepID=UPI00340625F8